jgi:hypothetical protein
MISVFKYGSHHINIPLAKPHFSIFISNTKKENNNIIYNAGGQNSDLRKVARNLNLTQVVATLIVSSY